MDQFNLAENVDTLFHSLENFTQKEGVIGKPVCQSDKTFMPIVSVSVGYGGGNASMGSKSHPGNPQAASVSSQSSGTGALGLGAKLNTEAVILIDNQNVSVIPLTNATGISQQIMDKIPQVVSSMSQNNQGNQSAQS